MAQPNIFVVDPAQPDMVVGVVSDDVAATKPKPKPKPKPAIEVLTDATPLKAAPRSRKD